MLPDVEQLMSDSGSLVAVYGTALPGGRFASIALQFTAGTLRLACNGDTDEIQASVGERPGGEPSVPVTALADLLGLSVDYAWDLTNHRGYTDGFQLRLTDGCGRYEMRQFEVAASAMDVRQVSD